MEMKMTNPKDALLKLTENISEWFIGFLSAVNHESNETVTDMRLSGGHSLVEWRNSAGQTVHSTMDVRRELENLAQAHIDSYASYHDEATPESRFEDAKGIAGMFANAARAAHVVEDVVKGGGRYRFTVHAERSGPSRLV